jgi:ubiquinone/menaquinone biosynthesis C-methylase UbiE
MAEDGSRGGGPDAAVARRQYERAAPGYDRHMRRLARWQRLAVARLQLARGQTVIDVACGTGLNFASIEEAIGPDGRIIGIDLSPEMLAHARERVLVSRWDNVTLIEAAVEQADIAAVADAALFSFTHDVLQSPRAVANVVAHLKPGARIGSAGGKLAARWNLPVNFVVRRAARPYISTFRNFDSPWRELERYVENLEIQQLAFGGAYVAWAQVRTAAPAEAASRLGIQET